MYRELLNDLTSISIIRNMSREYSKLADRVREYERFLPAAAWMIDPLWQQAEWSATTFRWHPTSDAPPIMGLVFDHADEARKLFQNWVEQNGNRDELEEIRVTIIEGDAIVEGKGPDEKPGYAVHLCPDPENSMIRATAEGIVLDELPLSLFGQVRCMFPVAGAEPLLPRFRDEFAKHQEYLLAPVTRGEDGQLYVDVECGIIKQTVHFQNLAVVDEQLLHAAKKFWEQTAYPRSSIARQS
ncbi:MAG: hypothetical protein K1Y02_25870 [Candidatus Hydrogenedentes bacterium]|nr:hypothetical protein [Candidatus Hydrogenedentota bacterium]